MKRILAGLLFLCAAPVVLAQNWANFHPRRNNALAGAVVSLPQISNIVFQHNFYDGVSTAQVGTGTYTRSGSVTYASDSSTLSEAGANVIPMGVRWNGTETLKGAYFAGAITNYLVRSEEFNNASWTAIGGGSASANTATSPMGTSTADTISGSSTGDGLAQDSGVAAASSTFVFSVWFKTSTGTATPKIIVKDAGTEGNIVECAAITTYRYPCQVPYTFSASATGNVSVQIIVDNSSNVRAWGAQLENFASGTTVGKRQRYSQGNNYVRTTSATATSGNSFYAIPTGIVTQIATKGSFAAWIYPEWDWTDICTPGNCPYLFSVEGEKLGFASHFRQGLTFWINDAVGVQLNTGSLQDATYGLAPYQWNHVVATWDTDADQYKIYINGSEVGSSTTARAAAVVGTNEMNLGGYNLSNTRYSDLGLDALMSQAVFWKVALSPSEVAQAYAGKQSIATRSLPSTGQIFSVDLGTSLVPTVGDTRHYFGTRKAANVPIYYPDSTTTLAATTATTRPAPAFPLGGYNKGGFYFSGPTDNLILQSEDIETTWATVGTITRDNNVANFLGTISYGTIVADDTEGITQTVATAIASRKWVFSTYASVGSGTLNARLTLEGSSGGTPETTNCDITLTTTPQRFSCYVPFTSGGTGNIKVSFKHRATGTSRVGGFMLEDATGDGSSQSFWKKPAPYIKTTTASKRSGWNQIVYSAEDSFNPLKGTAIAWAFLWLDPSTDSLPADGPTFIGAPGQFSNWYWHIGMPGNGYELIYGRVDPATAEDPYAATIGQWVQYGVTWDRTVSPAQFKLYIDGAEVDSRTSSSTVQMLPRKLVVGGDYIWGRMDFWHGAIDHMEIWGAPNPTAISDDWNTRKASYGR